VEGNVLNTTGTVMPGNSPGMLVVQGNYTQGPTGELAIELLSQGNFDRLGVTGNAMLDGTLSVSLLGGFAPAQDNAWKLLTAANVAGSFVDPQLPALTGDLAWKALYEPTSVSLVAYLPGDYNRDGITDAADYVVWRNSLGQLVALGSGADGDFDGEITEADYQMWRSHFGQTAGIGSGALTDAYPASIPEPTALRFACLVATQFFASHRFRHHRRKSRKCSALHG
jgi:hypothetical protein